MKKNKWLLALMTLLIVAVLAACGEGDDKNDDATTGSNSNGEEKKTLVVGTSADYPPFEYVDTANGDEIIGFDIELITLVAEKLGYEVKVENMDFNSLIPALQAKQFDVVIAGMSPTPERDEVVDFSVPYYETEQYVVFHKDKGFKDISEIKGTVGAQTSSIQYDLAELLAEEHGFKVESRNLIPELIQEIIIGRFDAAIIENIVSENYLANNSDLAALPIEVEDPDYKAIVFQEGSELKAEFDKVVEELINDGTIDKLKAKWVTGE